MNFRFFFVLGCITTLLACDSGIPIIAPASSPTSTSANSSFTIGGTLSNLGNNESVVLQNNGGDSLALTSNGSFSFSTSILSGSSYSVSVLTNPIRQTCTVTGPTGTISANITSITVNCVTTAPIIFVTASTFNGNLKAAGSAATGIANADSLCMADANYPSAGSFKALIVDGTNRVACTSANCSGGSSEHMDWVLAASTSYFESDGVTAVGTTTANGIFGFPVTNPVISVFVTSQWTGLLSDWTTGGDTCTTWTTNSNSLAGRAGNATQTGTPLINNGNPNCINDFELFCVEQ